MIGECHFLKHYLTVLLLSQGLRRVEFGSLILPVLLGSTRGVSRTLTPVLDLRETVVLDTEVSNWPDLLSLC